MHAKKLSAIITLSVIALIIGAFIFQVSPSSEKNPSTENISIQPESLTITWDPEGLNEKNLKNVALASNNFALTLLTKMLNSSKNTIISPLSIWLALAMLYEGSRGTTAQEMRNAMYLPENKSILEENIHYFLKKFENHTDNYTLSIADALWAQKGFDINPEYVKILENYYDAYFKLLNFNNSPERGREIINSWVENRTYGKIKELLPPHSITPETVAVLTNAIYFQAAWMYVFNESLTTGDFFYTPQGRISVDMMHASGDFRYTEDKDAQILELPYRDSNLSMLVVLPKGEHMNITLNKVMTWRENLNYAHVNISFPKFTLSTDYALKEVLESMGIRQVFTQSADLTDLSPSGGIWAGEVYHKVYISVSEKGTEAAAATAIPVVLGIIPSIDFNVNHPFLFLIQDRDTGAIFFMGWVANPLR